MIPSSRCFRLQSAGSPSVGSESRGAQRGRRLLRSIARSLARSLVVARRARGAGRPRAAGWRDAPQRPAPPQPARACKQATKHASVSLASREPPSRRASRWLWCRAGVVRSAGWGVVAISSNARSCVLSCRRMWKLITEALLVAQSTEQAARVPRAQLTDELAGGDRVVQLCVCEAPHSAIHTAGSQPRRKVRNRAPVRPVRDG